MRAGSWLSAAGCAALASLALLLPGCGDGSHATGTTSGAGRVVPTREEGKRPSADPVVAGACPTELSRFANSLQRLRNRLVAGLTYEEYVGAVRALRSEYAAIPIETIAPTCLLSTGTPSERAFNVYVEAANRWGECLSKPGCGGGDVEAPLQAEWRLAAGQLDALRRR